MSVTDLGTFADEDHLRAYGVPAPGAAYVAEITSLGGRSYAWHPGIQYRPGDSILPNGADPLVDGCWLPGGKAAAVQALADFNNRNTIDLHGRRVINQTAGQATSDGATIGDTQAPADVLAALEANTQPVDFNGQIIINVIFGGERDVRDYGVKQDGVTDDTAKMQNAINDAAANGWRLFVGAGVMLLLGSLVMPAGMKTTFRCSPLAIWKASISGSLATNAMLIGEVPATAGTTTLNGDTTIDSTSIVVAADTTLVSGVYVQIVPAGASKLPTTTFLCEHYDSTSKTITADRPIGRVFKSGDTLNVLAKAPPSFYFEGNGCTFTGTAVGWLYGNMWDAEISNVNGVGCTGTHVDYFMIWSYGAFRCVGRHIRTDAYGTNGTFNCGFGNIGSDSTGWEDVAITTGGSFASGIKHCDVVNTWDTNADAPGCGDGLFMGSDLGATSLSCVGVVSSGGHFDGGVVGINLTQGASNCTVRDFTANDNSSDGVQINGGGATVANFAKNNRLLNGTVKRSGGKGIVSTNGSPGLHVDHVDVEASVGDDLSIGDDARITNFDLVGTSTTNGVRNIRITGTANGRAVFAGFNANITTAGGGNFSFVAEAGDVEFRDGFMSLGTNCIGISSSGASVKSHNVTEKPRAGQTGTIGLYATAGTIQATDCDISTATLCSRAGGAIIINMSGAGAPGADASVGSMWRRTDGGVNTTLYVNSGGGAGGWAAVAA